MSIKIILVDDHKLFREGLLTLIKDEPGMDVIGEASDGLESVSLVQQTNPDIVIMDVSMPGINGIETTRRILSANRKVFVIGLSMYADKQFVGGMLGEGASAYLLKDCAFEELIEAIRTVFAGGIYLSPGVADGAMDSYLKRIEKPSPLTPRQIEVLKLLVDGRTPREIAEQLGLKTHTVEMHRNHLMKKLGTRSLATLTKYAVREGLSTIS